MSQGDELVREVEQIAYYNIEKNSQVVRVKVFVCCLCSEDQVEEFENEELEGGLGFTIQ